MNKDGPKHLTAEIIKRFMRDDEYRQFINEYRSSRKYARGSSRFSSLEEPITDREMEMVKEYFDNEEDNLKDIAETFNYSGNFGYKIGKICAKLLYQNRRLLDRV